MPSGGGWPPAPAASTTTGTSASTTWEVYSDERQHPDGPAGHRLHCPPCHLVVAGPRRQPHLRQRGHPHLRPGRSTPMSVNIRTVPPGTGSTARHAIWWWLALGASRIYDNGDIRIYDLGGLLR